MKVNSAPSQKIQKEKAPSREDIKAKIQAKFGVKVDQPKKKEKDVVLSIDKKGNKEISSQGFGDVKKNDPNSDSTKEKLKSILRTGAFDFNNKERSALGKILS